MFLKLKEHKGTRQSVMNALLLVHSTHKPSQRYNHQKLQQPKSQGSHTCKIHLITHSTHLYAKYCQWQSIIIIISFPLHCLHRVKREILDIINRIVKCMIVSKLSALLKNYTSLTHQSIRTYYFKANCKGMQVCFAMSEEGAGKADNDQNHKQLLN